MKVTLPNGMTIEGTAEQITNTAKALGFVNPLEDGIHYHSDSSGLIRIVDMNDNHLRNAILKMYRAWVADLSATPSNKTLVETLRTGPRNITLLAMIKELHQRIKG